MSPQTARESQDAKRITLKRGKETRIVVIATANLRDLGTPLLIGKDIEIEGKVWSVWDVQDTSIVARIQIAPAKPVTPKTPTPVSSAIRLRTSDIVRLSGATTRQIQWWHEHKIITAHKEGHANYYTRLDALKILVIVALRRKLVGFKTVRAAVRGVTEQLLASSDTFLVLSGSHARFTARFVEGVEAVLRIAREDRNGIRIVDLSEMAERVHAAYGARQT
jgi:DNA-binding transcriptional MerR regulator